MNHLLMPRRWPVGQSPYICGKTLKEPGSDNRRPVVLVGDRKHFEVVARVSSNHGTVLYHRLNAGVRHPDRINLGIFHREKSPNGTRRKLK